MVTEICCSCLGMLYCCYGSLIVGKICKEEYKDRLLKEEKIKKEYDTFRDIQFESELTNIKFTDIESKLSTIDETLEESKELY